MAGGRGRGARTSRGNGRGGSMKGGRGMPPMGGRAPMDAPNKAPPPLLPRGPMPRGMRMQGRGGPLRPPPPPMMARGMMRPMGPRPMPNPVFRGRGRGMPPPMPPANFGFDREREHPLYNRVFVISNPGYMEEDYRNAFSKYGDIQYYKQVDKEGKKTFTYITYRRASEAALAIEEMNGKPLNEGSTNRVRCLLATSKETRENQDKYEEKGKRILVSVGVAKTVDEIKADFKEYGEVEHVKLLTHRDTGKSRGSAFVTFKRPYCAAMALENLSKSYRPQFAEKKPKLPPENMMPPPFPPQNPPFSPAFAYDDCPDMAEYDIFDPSYCGDYGPDFEPPMDNSGAEFYNENLPETGPNFAPSPSLNSQISRIDSQPRIPHPADVIRNFPHEGKNVLYVTTANNVNTDNIEHLFRIIPGFESCSFDSESGEGTIRYTDSSCAAYAKDRLDGFEYPINYQLTVDFCKPESKETKHTEPNSSEISEDAEKTNDENCRENHDEKKEDTKEKEDEEASNEVKGEDEKDSFVRVRYCTFPVPDVRDIVSQMECKTRLFIVSKPSSFDNSIMKNLFCRYGNLIDAYFLPGKNYGFAKYGCNQSAEEALSAIDGKEVAGQLLRVVLADNEATTIKREASDTNSDEPLNKKSK
ncbi:DgyrCDS9044 [Dimorphilus gyrociliatus]|uniref:DgyrCDS9044 n=1 Tax=Dimorphilus gyrociliatus TaxID=2664684 RepID=A0A7I8VY64_9ANNE|nr:DgyrCDS9044 [Dimorphilus gyrociliatus]